MRTKTSIMTIALVLAGFIASLAQSNGSALNYSMDSALRKTIHQDSMKIEHRYTEKARFQKLLKAERFPVVNAGEYSGVLPVSDITWIPDPSMQYKLLFESIKSNPDSLMNEPDRALVQIARIINLHVASGIPLKNIQIIVVVHGTALHAICTNAWYQKKLKMDNPNLKLIKELERVGAHFIACGQAMDILGLKKNDLLPIVKVSLTAQTALTSYQLKGYVLKTMQLDNK